MITNNQCKHQYELVTRSSYKTVKHAKSTVVDQREGGRQRGHGPPSQQGGQKGHGTAPPPPMSKEAGPEGPWHPEVNIDRGGGPEE